MATPTNPFDLNDVQPTAASTSTHASGGGIPLTTPADTVNVLNDLVPSGTETISYAGSGLVFVNTYYLGNLTGADAAEAMAYRQAIIKAEHELQSHFANSVTLNLTFQLAPIDEYTAGTNTRTDVPVSYSALKNALTQHATTVDQMTAVNSLPVGDPSGGQMYDLAPGLAKLLGFAPIDHASDGMIRLNQYMQWGSFGDDAVSALEHEITEVMGRDSKLGVTQYDGGGTDPNWAPLDLFRYTATHNVGLFTVPLPTPERDYTGGKDGMKSYFSVDGIHLLSQFHNSVRASGFDGTDLGDWDISVTHDPFGKVGPGLFDTLSATDLTVMEVLGWNSANYGHRVQMTVDGVLDHHFGIIRTPLPMDQATQVLDAINSGSQTEAQYISDLLSQAANTTIPAVAIEASMYGVTGSSAEITKLVTQVLPAQIDNATHYGVNPLVYASEALGLAFAFGDENGGTAFAGKYGPSTAMPNSAAGDAAFAAAAAKAIFGSDANANTPGAIGGFVASWKAFFNSNGVPGIAHATADQIDLAARGAAWGDAVGTALANNLGPLHGQTINFLEDAAQGTAVYSAPFASQPTSTLHLVGTSAVVDHIA
jgi:hypothetical protein